MTTQLHGPPVWEVRHYPNPGTPLMWVGWAVCLVAAFFLIRRAVAARLQRRHDPAREETTRALTKALPFILLAAALLGTAINFLGEYAFPYFQAIVTILVAPVAMIGTVAAAAAWVRDRACPPLNSSRVKYRLPAA
jgi:cobalamin synthase